MNRPIAMLVATFLAACGAEVQGSAEGSEWLVGSWLPMAPENEYPLACESDAVVIYDGSGRYHVEGGRGVWQMAGDKLTEQLTNVDEEAVGPVSDLGPPLVSTIDRIDPDRFRKSYASGVTEIYRRCPD